MSDSDGINPETLKRIKDAGLRKTWSTIKQAELKKIAAVDKEDGKAAEKIFSKGLGPEIDNFYKILGSKKIDRAAVKKSHDKLMAIMAGYSQEITKAKFNAKSTLSLVSVIDHMKKAINDEWSSVDKNLK